ncbi:MAG: hypothetical protein PHO76_12630 [Methylotenera sp.]|nr:hypothetical protein [Methylotenera sp.]MDD4926811.1 hypothetical protein [Methylotenera sp.]
MENNPVEEKPSENPALNLTLNGKLGESDATIIARAAMSPELRAGMTLFNLPHTIPGTELASLVDDLAAQQAKVKANDLGVIENTLVAQSNTLDALFHMLITKAVDAVNFDYFNGCMQLALKAQNQSRATLASLSAIKNPAPVAYVRQANIGQTMHINNGIVANHQHALMTLQDSNSLTEISANIPHQQNELLEVIR